MSLRAFYKHLSNSSKLHQRQLLLPGQLLNLIFSPHSFLSRRKSLIINQHHRPFQLRITCPIFTLIMRLHSLFQTVRPPGVQRPIRTLHHIRIIQNYPPPQIYVKDHSTKAAPFSIMNNRLNKYFILSPKSKRFSDKNRHKQFFPDSSFFRIPKTKKAGRSHRLKISHLLHYTLILNFCECKIHPAQ